MSVVLAPLLNWRETFWVFGGCGIVWCILFALWFRNRPEEKAAVNAGELELIRARPRTNATRRRHMPACRGCAC